MEQIHHISYVTTDEEQPTLTAEDFMAMFVELSESGKKLIAQSILNAEKKAVQ